MAQESDYQETSKTVIKVILKDFYKKICKKVSFVPDRQAVEITVNPMINLDFYYAIVVYRGYKPTIMKYLKYRSK